jgi:hypothetical protein
MNKPINFQTLTTPAQRRLVLIEARASTGLTAAVFGRLMNNGKADGDAVLYKKEADLTSPSHKGTTYTDVMSAELLCFLDSQGYDVQYTEFDKCGRIVNIPKK